MTSKGQGADGRDEAWRGEGGLVEEPRSERRRSTQFGRSGRPRMANLAEAVVAARRAVAEAEVAVSQETLSAIVDGTVPRGDVLSVCELAGVMAAKRAPELIPLVHATPLTELLVVATPDRAAGSVRIRVETAAVAASGVEMEALTAAGIAALTLYDMVRDLDPEAEVLGVRLLSSAAADAPEWKRTTFRAAHGHGERPKGARMAGRTGPAPIPGNSRRGPRP